MVHIYVVSMVTVRQYLPRPLYRLPPWWCLRGQIWPWPLSSIFNVVSMVTVRQYLPRPLYRLPQWWCLQSPNDLDPWAVYLMLFLWLQDDSTSPGPCTDSPHDDAPGAWYGLDPRAVHDDDADILLPDGSTVHAVVSMTDCLSEYYICI